MKMTVEKDLLKILKHKKEDELFYTIIKMVNGTYNYEFKYLNKMPYENLMLYLEKTMVLLSNYKGKLTSLNDFYSLVDSFCDKLIKLDYNSINDLSLNSLKYDVQIKYNYLKINRIEKKKVAALVLSFVLFFSMVSKKEALATNNMNENDQIVIEEEKKVTESEIIKKVFDNISSTLNVSLTEIEEDPIEEVIEEVDEVVDPIMYGTNPDAQPTITIEDRINYVCNEYNLTKGEFNVVAAICMAEAKEGNYIDTYAVISVIYNRTHNTRWVNWIAKITGLPGNSLYAQVIADGQFSVYSNGRYENFLGIKDGDSFLAILDMLESGHPSHDYLQFRSNKSNVYPSEMFVEGGNKYFELMPENERITNSSLSL